MYSNAEMVSNLNETFLYNGSLSSTDSTLYEVEVCTKGEMKYTAIINNETVDVDILSLNRLSDNEVLLECLVNGIKCRFIVDVEAGSKVKVLHDGYFLCPTIRQGLSEYQGDVYSPEEKASLVLSPMPSVVAELLVEVGDQVKEGEPLIRIEAMKMINTLASPCAGLVDSILIRKDDIVSADQLLIKIEP